MSCDIIMPIWDQLEYTKSCIEHIEKNTRYPYKLILIDNGSDFNTKSYLENLKNTKGEKIDLIRNAKNLGFVKAVNQGLRISDAPYVCILNNDTLPGAGWLTELVGFAEEHADTGLLNPLSSGHLAENLTVNGYAKKVFISDKGKYMEMNQCQGFCMLIKRELIKKIGHLDEQFGIGGFDDTDYSRRAELAGYKCVSVYSSYVYHSGHGSFDKMGDRKKIQSVLEEKFFKKWPRHKRIAMIFSVSENTTDKKIEIFLNSALFLAREWWWVNIFIYGDKSTNKRVDALKNRIGFPLHQNLKFNYRNRNFKIFDIAVRILERSLGKKARKKYDAVICDEKKLIPFLKFLCRPQGCQVFGEPAVALSNIASKTKPSKAEPDKCDIILPVCGHYEFTKKCVDSIIKHTISPFRLILINNGKDENTRVFLEEIAKRNDVDAAVMHNSENAGWVRSLNAGIKISEAPYICFQNNDTIVTQNWLKKLIDILGSQNSFGMINPTWEGRPQGVSIDEYNLILEKNKGKFIETDWCRGFSMVIKREVMEKIGPVDEAFGLGYLDDVDYSVRAIEAGFRCLLALDTYVYHERNVTASTVLKEKWEEIHEKNKRIYHKKWGRPLKIVVVLDGRFYRDEKWMDKVEETLFSLARKQHHVDVWCPRILNGRFQHTNIKIKAKHPFLLKSAILFDNFMNQKKKLEKRYDLFFDYSTTSKIEDYNKFIIRKAEEMKEKTKEKINV